MSKAKTKKARRELKRDGARKIAAHHRKVAKASTTPSNPNATAKPSSKKQKKNMTTATTTTTPSSHSPSLQASQKHDIPFGTYDYILLVGEGDFSFTHSLALAHGCANITSTSLDTAPSIREKYPSFEAIRADLEGLTPPVPIHHAVDATKVSTYKHLRCVRDDDDDDGDDEGKGWDTIAFMFPHTGGLSTHVNRQVRSNQALLVSFFKSCLETATSAQRMQVLASQRQMHGRKKPTPLLPLPQARAPFLRMGGRIVVTLFEGEPYSLWNVRDLARHVGLKVVESWKFDAGQYPGYKHVRTLGAIEGGGGWKGEDREARVYVFEKVPLVADSDEEKELELRVGGKKRREKRVREERMSEDEED
ncbi:hypothetical protein GQ44DRAFT_740115 [Phaeosphaeriaceae sp. PMI808]|nr:hypothetical protein GQ44DRAFT_740115 [Phaeosphaeriaceae sp. PMI808]